MPKNILEPAAGHVLLVDSPRETMIEGITMPDNVKQQEMVFGTVVFVGPGMVNTKVQDRVCYGPYAGKNVVLEGIEFRLMKEEQIEAYVRAVEGS
jgi:chaperonin GroES